jgi:hypothetical protein
LLPWVGKNIIEVGRTSFVKSLLSSIVRFYISLLVIPPSTLDYINKIISVVLWAGTYRPSELGKNAVNWKIVWHQLADLGT